MQTGNFPHPHTLFQLTACTDLLIAMHLQDLQELGLVVSGSKLPMSSRSALGLTLLIPPTLELLSKTVSMMTNSRIVTQLILRTCEIFLF